MKTASPNTAPQSAEADDNHDSLSVALDRLRYGTHDSGQERALSPRDGTDAVVRLRRAVIPSPSPAGGTQQGPERPVLLVSPEKPHTPSDLRGPTLAVMALGVLLMAWVAIRGRADDPHEVTDGLYWLALSITFAPALLRVLAQRVCDGERVALCLGTGLLLQIDRTVLYPVRFQLHDELIHQNGVRLLDQTHHLFAANPLLPVTAYYPGLEIVTNAIHQGTGLSIHSAGVVVLLAARVLLTVALIGILRLVTGSLRIACIGSLIYATNSQYLVFNSQFSYQTLALPLAVFAVYVVALRARVPGRRSVVLPVLAIAATAVTHHLTSMLLVVGLVGWYVIDWRLRSRKGPSRRRRWGLIVIGGVAAVLVVSLAPGNPLASYLGSIFSSAATGVDNLVHGSSGHTLFVDSAGDPTPEWEKVASFAAIAVIFFPLLAALWRGREWWRRRDSLAVSLLVVAVIYPLVPAGHLAAATAEVTDRAAGFVFLGIAFALSWWLVSSGLLSRRFSVPIVTLVLLVAFVGDGIVGAGSLRERVPGPYEVAADAPTFDAANLAAARWLSENVPAGTRIYADRDSGLIDAAVGGTYTVTHVGTGIDASRILLAPTFTPIDATLIREADIQYVVVDTRDASSLPHEGVYIESGEYGSTNPNFRVSPQALHKLALVPGVTEVYTNGPIDIYDVEVFDAP